MFRAEISEETLLSIPSIKGLIPEILLFKRKGAVSRDFSLRDGILPTDPERLKKNILWNDKGKDVLWKGVLKARTFCR
jgi:hypothetical protein